MLEDTGVLIPKPNIRQFRFKDRTTGNYRFLPSFLFLFTASSKLVGAGLSSEPEKTSKELNGSSTPSTIMSSVLGTAGPTGFEMSAVCRGILAYTAAADIVAIEVDSKDPSAVTLLDFEIPSATLLNSASASESAKNKER